MCALRYVFSGRLLARFPACICALREDELYCLHSLGSRVPQQTTHKTTRMFNFFVHSTRCPQQLLLLCSNRAATCLEILPQLDISRRVLETRQNKRLCLTGKPPFGSLTPETSSIQNQQGARSLDRTPCLILPQTNPTVPVEMSTRLSTPKISRLLVSTT